MKKSLRVLFFGNERIATGIHSTPAVLRALIESGRHEVAGLVIHASGSTSRTKATEPVVELAESHTIAIINPESPIDAVEQIKSCSADIGVLVAYGKIVPKEIIDLFPLGIINLHPSELPKLRGSTPVESVLLSGQSETAISIMRLVTKMDAGPVLAQKMIPIPAGISKQDLADTLHVAGAELMLTVLDDLSNKTQREIEQNEDQATYCNLLNKSDGLLDWSKPAVMLEREIRAYAGWPKSRTNIGDIDISIQVAEVIDGWGAPNGTIQINFETSKIAVQCSSSALSIVRLTPSGRGNMDSADFLNGYRNKLLGIEQLEVIG